MKVSNAWLATLGQLQMEMSKAAYDTWVKDAQLISHEDSKFVVGLKNDYARDFLEERLATTIRRKLEGFTGGNVELRFIVWQDPSPAQPPPSSQRITTNHGEITDNPTVNKRYTFNNFVVGTSNRLAHAASLAVAEKPANAYNPLFLYGGVGLGKTHLLHAIGNHCTASDLNVLYTSSEEFTNDLINAIRNRNTQSFRDKYRNIDVLLIDDIQFIAGKESTQEEFFHTFNTLHGQNKQIILSSDRPPKAMSTLEERLRSRFEWGLIADIQPPDYETRVAILRSKAERSRVVVPEQINEIIARKFQSNIRELEGALTRVIAYADLRGLPLSPSILDEALTDLLPKRRDVDPNLVIDAISKEFGIPREKLVGKERTKQIALSRQMAMYIMREDGKISLPQIGKELGGRDHSTILYGCEKVSDLIESDETIRKQMIAIREKLYGDPVSV